MTAEKPLTHTAYALKRESRTTGRWLEIGEARIESDGKSGHIYIDCDPIGGPARYIYLLPIGVKPDEPSPQQLDQLDNDEDG